MPPGSPSLSENEREKILLFTASAKPSLSYDAIHAWFIKHHTHSTVGITKIIDLIDENQARIASYNAIAMPEEGENYFIDPRGVIHIRVCGAAYWDTDRDIIRSVGGMAPTAIRPKSKPERHGQVLPPSTHSCSLIASGIIMLALASIAFWFLRGL